MVAVIAPLDYERYAVLVNPLLAPGAEHTEAHPPTRQTEQPGPVNAALSGTSSRAGEGLREPVSRPMEVRRKSFERGPEPPLNEPYPTDLNWFFQLPSGVRESAQGRPVLDPWIVTGLYDHPETPRGATLSVSG